MLESPRVLLEMRRRKKGKGRGEEKEEERKGGEGKARIPLVDKLLHMKLKLL